MSCLRLLLRLRFVRLFTVNGSQCNILVRIAVQACVFVFVCARGLSCHYIKMSGAALSGPISIQQQWCQPIHLKGSEAQLAVNITWQN